MALGTIYIAYGALGLMCFVLARSRLQLYKNGRNPKKLPFPPGPKPLPVIGNLLDLPGEHQWLTYDRWAKQYGPVMSVDAAGSRIVILTSAEAVDDLLERRSAIYSSRPRMVMLVELMGFTFNTGLMPYGEAWRTRRRTFHQYIHQGAIKQWEPIVLREVHNFLRKLLDSSNVDDLTPRIEFLFGAIIMDIVYGVRITDAHDPYLSIPARVAECLGQALVPGAFFADLIPALKYIPGWMPGAGFKRLAADSTRLVAQMVDVPFSDVKKALKNGQIREGMVADLLSKTTPHAGAELVIRDVAGVAYIAGADTTASALSSLFLAMVTHQDVQRRAQAELDAVVGNDRLPDFSDREELPYITAIVLEVLRWLPVTPLAVPHATTEDDEYNGFFIPRGSIVVGNAWSILHDPEAYRDPEVFKPERFLRAVPGSNGTLEINPDVRDPRTACFGFGRRVCQGRHMAEQSLFSVAASVLAAFTITPKLDANGVALIPEVGMTPGTISHPIPFRFTIKPRSALSVKLIRGLGPDVEAEE